MGNFVSRRRTKRERKKKVVRDEEIRGFHSGYTGAALAFSGHTPAVDSNLSKHTASADGHRVYEKQEERTRCSSAMQGVRIRTFCCSCWCPHKNGEKDHTDRLARG